MKTPLIYALFVAFLSGSPPTPQPGADSPMTPTRTDKAAAKAGGKAGPHAHDCPNGKGDQG